MTELFSNPIFICMAIPAVFCLVIPLIPQLSKFTLQKVSFSVSLAVIASAIWLTYSYQPQNSGFQFTYTVQWIKQLNINYSIGVDGFGVLLILLTSFFTTIAIALSRHIKKFTRLYYACLFLLEAATIGLFSSLDLFMFYFLWEVSLPPVFFMAGIWGTQLRLAGSKLFFLLSALCSALMEIAILWLVYENYNLTGVWTFSILQLYNSDINTLTQISLFILLGISFFVRIPLFPFHMWFPAFSGESPASGNIILSGFIIPAGIYGIVRVLLPMFPEGGAVLSPYISFLCVLTVIYCSLMAWSKHNFKKLAAYLISANTALAVFGIVSLNMYAVRGGVLHCLGVAVSSAALFILCGCLQNRTGSVIMDDYGGLAVFMPKYSIAMIITLFSFMIIPCLSGFVANILILVGTFSVYPWLTGFALIGILLFAVCVLNILHSLLFGTVGKKENMNLPDLNYHEYLCLIPLIILMFVLGAAPDFPLKYSENSAEHLMNAQTKVQDETGDYK